MGAERRATGWTRRARRPSWRSSATTCAAATAELQKSAAKALGGTVTSSTGDWQGCEAGGLEDYKNFQYLADVRIDVATAARPYLDHLGAVFEEAGFGPVEPGERPGGSTLHGKRDDIGASFSELPDQGDYVLLNVGGPCVDVPEDERDDWLTKDEPEPEISSAPLPLPLACPPGLAPGTLLP